MNGYRLYYLDKDGHIVAAAEAELPGDVEAHEWAIRLIDERDAELWRGAHVVEKLQASA